MLLSESDNGNVVQIDSFSFEKQHDAGTLEHANGLIKSFGNFFEGFAGLASWSVQKETHESDVMTLGSN